MRRTLVVNTTLSALMFVGCMHPTETDESSDRQYASFMSALSADFGLDEQSPEVVELLAMVNVATYEQLDIEARLNARAARQIIAHRSGPDGTEPSPDDNLFETLVELDQVPYVGPVALERLLGYAGSGQWQPDMPALDLPPELSTPEHIATLEEQLMLEVVNTSDFVTLDDTVGLNRLAAESIINTRAGADGIIGSHDDLNVDSVEMLDAIPYVGNQAMNTLRDYVTSSGLLDSALATATEAWATAQEHAQALPELRMLELANRANLEELDIMVGLDQRAANAIINHREGPDGVAGNDDDGWFGSRQDLDDIRWVGDSALAKLEAYATALGYDAPAWTQGWEHDRVRIRFDLPLRRYWAHHNPSQGFERTLMVCDVNIRTGRVLCRRRSAQNAQCSAPVYSCSGICEATEEDFIHFESGSYQYDWDEGHEFFSCYSCWDPQSPQCQSPCTSALAGTILSDGTVTLTYERLHNTIAFSETVNLHFEPYGLVTLASYDHEQQWHQSMPSGTISGYRHWWNCGENTIAPFGILPF